MHDLEVYGYTRIGQKFMLDTQCLSDGVSLDLCDQYNSEEDMFSAPH